MTRDETTTLGGSRSQVAGLEFARMQDQGRWDHDLLAVIKGSRTLCLQIDDPGWEDARGYLVDESAMTLYFPVAKKYLRPPLSRYEVLIWDEPRVLVRGELEPATSEEDTATQLSLARASGLDEDTASYMLLDQRTQKTRRTRYKLTVRDITRADAPRPE
jgi:hypothetical protein